MITVNLLNKVLTLSCGIGSSLAEANSALSEAKKNKSSGYSIVNYDGVPFIDKVDESLVSDYKNIRDFIIGNLFIPLREEDQAVLKSLETLLYDPQTKALNKLGFAIERERKKYQDSSFLLFDGNGMHYWNRNPDFGCEWVDQMLGVVGTTLSESIRDEDYALNRKGDSLVHRVNGCGGDEFLVYTSEKLNSDDATKLAHRLMDKIYIAELKELGYSVFFEEDTLRDETVYLSVSGSI